MSGVADAIGLLVAAYPQRPMGEATIQVYVRELADVPPDLLAEAVSGLIRTSEWPPTVAAIRREAAERSLALPSRAQAVAQADAVIEWARRQDGTPRPAVEPLVELAVREIGGYHALREDERARWRLDEAYGRLRDQAVRTVQLGSRRPELAPSPERKSLHPA